MENGQTALSKEFWNERYRKGEIGWDLKGAAPAICQYVDSINDKSLQVLIPGCGNAYEAQYMFDKGFENITLLDISSTLVDELQKKFESASIRVVCRDYFEHRGQYDVILEQTFFCAIDPELRENYVTHTHGLLKKGGRVAGLLFNREFDTPGPPFGGNQKEYEKLFGREFASCVFSPCENSVKPRMGTELFFEAVK